MRVKKLGLLLAMLAIASLSFMRLDCEDVVDKVKDAASGLDITKVDFREKAIYFTDPLYDYKAGKLGQQEEGKYKIIDIIGKKKIKKYVPVLIYFTDYIDGDTFDKDNVKFIDQETKKELPGLYLLTFRWDGSVKVPKIKNLKDAMEAVKNFKDFPKKSMAVIIPFSAPKGKVKITINGKDLKDVKGFPMAGKPKPPTAPTAASLNPAPGTPAATEPVAPAVLTDDAKATALPADQQCITDPDAEPIYEADAEADTTEYTPRSVSTTIDFEADDGNFVFSGNAGRITLASVFTSTDAAKKPDFAGQGFATKSVLLTSGELYYFVSGSDFWCANTAGTSIDDTKMAVDGASSTMSAVLNTGGKKYVKFDYYFISAEIPEWCAESTNYNDELTVSIASTSGRGQPTFAAIETQSKYFGVKTQLPNLKCGSSGTDLPATFANSSNDKSFAIANLTPANALIKQTASFALDGLGEEINLTITVSDVGDNWNTTMAVIDNVRFDDAE
jgi:hypothetical protein